MLIASTFLLWIVVAVLAIAVLALTRQVGVLNDRIAPMGTLLTEQGADNMPPGGHATTLDSD